MLVIGTLFMLGGSESGEGGKTGQVIQGSEAGQVMPTGEAGEGRDEHPRVHERHPREREAHSAASEALRDQAIWCRKDKGSR